MCGKRILQSCSASSIHRKYSGSTCKCNAKISWSCAQQTCAGCECWTINLIRAKSPEVTLRDGPIPVWVRMILSHGSWYETARCRGFTLKPRASYPSTSSKRMGGSVWNLRCHKCRKALVLPVLARSTNIRLSTYLKLVASFPEYSQCVAKEHGMSMFSVRCYQSAQLRLRRTADWDRYPHCHSKGLTTKVHVSEKYVQFVTTSHLLV